MTENFSQPMKEIYRFKEPSNNKYLFPLGNLGIAQLEINKKRNPNLDAS